VAKKRQRTRTATGLRYRHAGWSGRRDGDLLLPVARQQGVYADALRMSVVESRKLTADQIADDLRAFIETGSS
jgi:hypothetical protein